MSLLLCLLLHLLPHPSVAQHSASQARPASGPPAAKAALPQRIPLERLPAGHLVVRATVNGVSGRFILDTGAGLHLLTKKFAQRVSGLHLQDGRFTGFRAIGQRLDSDLYTAQTISIGSFQTSSTTLTIDDFDLGGVDGLLSLTAFQQQPFTLDYQHQQLILETPASLAQRRKTGQVVPLHLGQYFGLGLDMAAYFRVNEKLTLLLLLDSGTPKGSYRLSAIFAPKLGIDTAAIAPAKRYRLGGDDMGAYHNLVYRSTLDELTTPTPSPIHLTKVPVELVSGLIYDGILPLDWMGNQVTIDLAHQVLLVN